MDGAVTPCPAPGAARTAAILLTARWVVGHAEGRHRLSRTARVVFEDGAIIFVGHGYPGRGRPPHRLRQRPDRRRASSISTRSPTSTPPSSAIDNQPAWKKGRVWPRTYLDAGPYEMYSREELAFQKRYAFATLIRNGITTALPIASLFYRAWGETVGGVRGRRRGRRDLGLRAYLGPAYRTGNQVVEADGTIATHYDEARGLRRTRRRDRLLRAPRGRGRRTDPHHARARTGSRPARRAAAPHRRGRRPISACRCGCTAASPRSRSRSSAASTA